MTHKPQTLRTAIFALSASIVLPTAPVFGQDAPVIAPPPPVTAPAPAPVVAPAPPPVATAEPAPEPRAQAPVRTTRAAARTTRAAAPASRPATGPVPAAEAAPPPVPATETVATADAALPPAETIPAAPAVDEDRSGVGELGATGSILPWILLGIGLVLAGLAFFAFRRRRYAETDGDVYYEEPELLEATPGPTFGRPVAVEPVADVPPPMQPAFIPVPADSSAREIVEPEVAEAASEDVEALAASSAPRGNRPWLEFLMRPVRAGTSKDDAIVQFELTVGNTGEVEARDVTISTWMVAGGRGSEMERSLITPPADAQVSKVDISAGDGARVEAELAVPKGSLGEPVLPVVVADARYRLPDGSEGRTHAAFEIGLPADEEDGLAPFPVDRASGLRENVEARLHGEPERV